MSRFLVIGGGITGCTSGLELAQQGHSVTVIESNSAVGGKVLSYCCKATDECSRCGVCISHTQIHDALHHPGIEITAAAKIIAFSNDGKKISAKIQRLNPAISHTKCTACDACVQKCPEGCITKYNRAEVVQYVIDHSRCRLQKGEPCTVCADVCPAGAIVGKEKTDEIDISADAVLVAIGHEPFDARLKPRFGYSRVEGVYTGAEAEEILSKQPYLSAPNENVAFVQCVGSRDAQIGKNYCSSVCCAYAFRMAKILKHKNKDAQITVYYIDVQNFDKAFSDFHEKLDETGVRAIRAIPFSIDPNGNGKLKLRIENADGNKSIAEHDAVILSVGMGPALDSGDIAKLLQLDSDEFGFLRSSIPNVFVAGTCSMPQSIPDCIASAKAVACDMGRIGK
jgi:heterodisulfide reductase subunit A